MSVILFADDEQHLRSAAGQTFQLADMPIELFSGARPLLDRIDANFDGVIVTDIRMPEMDGIALLNAVLVIDPTFPVIMVTGHGDVELAVSCMQAGAYDFVEKPYEPTRLVDSVRRAIEKRRLTLENRELRNSLAAQDQIGTRLTGNSKAIEKVRQKIHALAGLDADVLLVGDTGTGKDVAAHMLHELSARSRHPFVQINCAALPADLVEIELFGHEVGAFPGAIRSRYGKFEHARGGTVFLDEIEALSTDIQAKLLLAIEKRSITPLGSNEQVELDIRIVSASKTDLKAAVDAGTFRDDLYYRLAGAEIFLPTLDERMEDLPRLFGQLVASHAKRHERDTPEILPAVLSNLAERSWPGNIRELSNVAERYVLGLDLQLAQDDVQAKQPTLAQQMASQERALIAASLAANQGRINQTFEALGISRKALYEKMQKHGLLREDFVGD